jgi:hypothetical protein
LYRPEFLDDLGAPNPVRLMNSQAETQSSLFHGRDSGLLASTFRAVGLGVDREHSMSGSNQALERRHGEFRRPKKN